RHAQDVLCPSSRRRFASGIRHRSGRRHGGRECCDAATGSARRGWATPRDRCAERRRGAVHRRGGALARRRTRAGEGVDRQRPRPDRAEDTSGDLRQVTNDLLAAIVACARTSAEDRASAARATVEREAEARMPRGDAFRETLRAPGVRVIAECKRRSPSRGILRARYDAAAIAAAYEAAGAAAISVLTEPAFFDGKLDHLRAGRQRTTR